eukprot:gene3017-3577_t
MTQLRFDCPGRRLSPGNFPEWGFPLANATVGFGNDGTYAPGLRMARAEGPFLLATCAFFSLQVRGQFDQTGCSDRVTQPPETCDDGNLISGAPRRPCVRTTAARITAAVCTWVPCPHGVQCTWLGSGSRLAAPPTLCTAPWFRHAARCAVYSAPLLGPYGTRLEPLGECGRDRRGSRTARGGGWVLVSVPARDSVWGQCGAGAAVASCRSDVALVPATVSLLPCCVCCSAAAPSASVGALAGAGRQRGTEQCDDGNTVAGDGCSPACQIEARCGDGTVTRPEQCDDANQ